MGTVVDIEIRNCDLDESTLSSVSNSVISRLSEIDEMFSTYKSESEISRLGRGELTIASVSPDVRTVLDLCEKLHATTDGYFDIFKAASQGPAVELQKSDIVGARPLEPSGAVKGWAIEQGVDILRRAGITSFCINLGGDLYASGPYEGSQGWRIGLQHPYEKQKVMAVLEVRDCAVATSGLYERGEHIVSADGGTPTGLVSVTLVGADITLADAYATAAFAMGLRGMLWASELPGFDVFAVDDVGMTHFSPNMKQYIRP